MVIINSNKFSFYYRYVDDIILTIPANNLDKILKMFNDYHERLKFTVELERNRCLNFLDLTIKIVNNNILIDWYQKDTCSGRVLSYFSGHPMCHKIGIIYNLTDRCLLLSHPLFYNKNIRLIIEILLNNGFPLDLIFSKINQRIKYLVSNNVLLNRDNNVLTQSKKISEMDDDNGKKIIVFPYINKITEMIVSSFKKKTNNKANILVGYRCMNKLNKIIRTHKDTNEHTQNSNVVYKICCNECDATYVGQTKRQLKTRIKEHMNNIKMNSNKHSVISEHRIKDKHTFDWENVKILDRESNYYKRSISEMLNIKEQRNGLNLNKDTELLSDSYSDTLKRIAFLYNK